ncbi:hypothetical protein GGI43DRAFT_331630 [Trichoderma evansii]
MQVGCRWLVSAWSAQCAAAEGEDGAQLWRERATSTDDPVNSVPRNARRALLRLATTGRRAVAASSREGARSREAAADMLDYTRPPALACFSQLHSSISVQVRAYGLRCRYKLRSFYLRSGCSSCPLAGSPSANKGGRSSVWCMGYRAHNKGKGPSIITVILVIIRQASSYVLLVHPRASGELRSALC